MKTLLFFALLVISGVSYSAEFKIIDALTGEFIKNADVTVIHRNTIRCMRAPCPSNEMKYAIKSNGEGMVKFRIDPKSEDAKIYSIRATGYKAQHYFKVKSTSELGKYLELVPVSIDKTYRLIIFIDQNTNKPIQNKKVWIASSKDCYEGKCKDLILEAKTNRLGNVFYKFLEVFPKGLSQMAPVYMHIKGYKPYERHHHHRGSAVMVNN